MKENKKKDTAQGKCQSKKQVHYNSVLGSMSSDSQNYTILKHLIEYGTITTMEAYIKYSITRLSGRIYDIKNNYGVDVRSRTRTAKNKFGKTRHFSEYYLGGK